KSAGRLAAGETHVIDLALAGAFNGVEAGDGARGQKKAAAGGAGLVDDLHMVEDGADADHHQVLAGREGLTGQLRDDVTAGGLDHEIRGGNQLSAVEEGRRRLHAGEEFACRRFSAAGDGDGDPDATRVDGANDRFADGAAADDANRLH